MNIEQIALEVASEMGRDGFFSRNALTEFLRRCLSKLAEQAGEPAYWLLEGELYEVQQYCLLSDDGPIPGQEKLYTEAQLIAAQQKVAEACARYCAQTLSPSKTIPDDSGRAWIAGTIQCADGIRNGEWREYL